MQSENKTFLSENQVQRKLLYNKNDQYDYGESPQFMEQVQDSESNSTRRTNQNLQKYQNILERFQAEYHMVDIEPLETIQRPKNTSSRDFSNELDRRLEQLDTDKPKPYDQQKNLYKIKGYDEREEIDSVKIKSRSSKDQDSPAKELSGVKLIDESSDQLEISDIITNLQTNRFLNRNFLNKQEKILTSSFVERLLIEFELEFESKEEFKIFRRILIQKITTSDPNILSLNALEIQTKEFGLSGFIQTIKNLAKDLQKQQQQSQINSQIVNELAVVKKMLETKQVNLKVEEARVQQLIDSQNIQRKQIFEVIQKQYDMQIKLVDDVETSKLNQLNKRIHVIEQNIKQKIKLLENKYQMVTKRNTNQLGEVEKWKSKVFSLEKQLECSKQRNIDLEKRLATEKEYSQTAQTRADKLTNKIFQLEKIMKELNEKQSNEPQTIQPEQEQEEKNQQIKQKDPKEIDSQTSKISKQSTLTKKKVPSQTATVLTKDEIIKISLNLLEQLIGTFSTFKIVTQYEQKISDSLLTGEIFYPQISSIIPQLIEMIPIIFTQPIFSEQTYIISQILLDSCIFAYRLKNKDFEPIIQREDLEKMRQRLKSTQEHVNEVMQTENNKSFEVVIQGLTQYWRKKQKIPKDQPLVQNKNQKKSFFQLVQTEELQNELVQLLLQFIQNSQFYVHKGQQSQNSTHFEIATSHNFLINEKKIYLSRCNSCFLIILLAIETKDVVLALKTLVYDMQEESEHISQYIKQYITELEISHLVVSRMQRDQKDFSLLQSSVELILELCSKGHHQQIFLGQLVDFVKILFQLFLTMQKENEFSEKLSIVIQRIVYHYKITQDMSTFIDSLKLRIIDPSIENFPLLKSNLQSIISIFENDDSFD